MDSGKPVRGPVAWMNWRAFLTGERSRGAHETALHSDAGFEGGLVLGPYEILNPFSMQGPIGVSPAVILRSNHHGAAVDPPPPIWPADASSYHGGSDDEEMASLLSLGLGVRLKAGGVVRLFLEGSSDPRGTPLAEWSSRPLTPLGTSATHIVPRAFGKRQLESGRLDRYPALEADDAVALVRSARLYQDALWICETQPHLAWLLVVSALEVAADHYATASSADPLDRLRLAEPKLSSILESELKAASLKKVVAMLAGVVQATAKFIGFLERFWPDPPDDRPPEAFQFPWEWSEAERAMRKIYHHRSKALHAGTPFPDPMCYPPDPVANALAEVPTGLGTATLGGSWSAKDTPINLHTFEYIARRSLHRWWESITIE